MSRLICIRHGGDWYDAGYDHVVLKNKNLKIADLAAKHKIAYEASRDPAGHAHCEALATWLVHERYAEWATGADVEEFEE